MRGIGDAYKANLFSGTGSYSIPIPVTPSRGFAPELSLDYSSGEGNTEFGLGFSISLPRISVSTEKRIPRYDGSDGFTMSGQGELVLEKSTPSAPNPRNVDHYEVYTYLPRIESAFSRIERWKEEDSGEIYWKVTSSENVVSYFGRDAAARIFNPDNPGQVFEWLVEESIDPRGNRIVYSYKEENDQNIPKAVYEVNHSFRGQRYIQRIAYGNYVKQDGGEQAFAFNLLFDYGEYDAASPLAAWTPVRDWPCRPDPYSSYRSGFEIRTYRLCRNILLFHCFENELGAPFLVKATALEHDNQVSYDPIRFHGLSKLKRVQSLAFRKASEEAFGRQDLPPLEFGWSDFNPPERPGFKILTSGGYDIPGFIEPGQFFPVDLNGEGIPGLLYTDGTSVMYLEPEGEGHFKRPESLTQFPVNKHSVSIQDIDGNGQLELVVADGNKSGFYERQGPHLWQNFQPFQHYPTTYADPYLETADLEGNGRSDLLSIGTEEIHIYGSEGKKGYEPQRVVKNVNQVPISTLGDPALYVGFADVFGDGQPHRIRVRNRSVECWPSLGYGNFGRKITLGNPPDFGEDFSAERVFLTDIDGSGTADLAYVYPDRVEIYLNQEGNSFSDPVVIYLPAPFSALDQVNFADILGNGTSCLVFTKIAPTPIQYWYNFAGETDIRGGAMKPYLLCRIDNHLGTVTTIKYRSSSHYAMEDKLKGRPWATVLPFPVQVVAETSTYDQLSDIRSVTRYSWHDGYYDPVERAFRGFGYVESWDSASIYTRTWYLIGAFGGYDDLLRQYKREYFNKDTAALDFPDSYFDSAVYRNGEATLRQAYAALRDKPLRQEIYGPDNEYPYRVEAHNYSVVLIQAAEASAYGTYRIDGRESIYYDYERNPADPVTRQAFVLEVDAVCGEVTKECTVFLSRRAGQTAYPEQKVLQATAGASLYINTGKQQPYWYRGILYDQQSFELHGLNIGGARYFSYADIRLQAGEAMAHIVPYLGNAPEGLYVSQTSWNTSYFWDENQGEALNEGEISSRALLHHLSQEVYTKDNIKLIYGDRLSEAVLFDQGGYTYNEARGYYENRGLVQHYFKDPDSFFVPWKVENSFVDQGSALYRRSVVEYDAYFLATIVSRQYLDEKTENVTRAEIDYQVMQPKQMIDVNGNVSQVLFDPFGQVVASSQFGKAEGGMRLYAFDGQPAEYVRRDKGAFDDVIDRPEYYLQGAACFFFYSTTPPVSVVSLQRYNYYHLEGGTSPFSCRTEVEFSDGQGRSIERKMRVEPGVAFMRDAGKILDMETDTRWLVSGRTVYNSMGLISEAYLAYFSNTPHYETQITDEGLVPPPTRYYYDALKRLIREDTPKGFFKKVEYTAWEEAHFDEDDTVLDSAYYTWFMSNYPANPTQAQEDEMDALKKAAPFFETPVIYVRDNTGSLIREIQTEEKGRQLVSFLEEDTLGRKVLVIDPRLFNSNQDKGTQYYSFRYLYPMGVESHASSDSADAGLDRTLDNIFSNQCWSISARNYCQVIAYDPLGRKTGVSVKLIEYEGPVVDYADFNLVEVSTYGETQQDTDRANLRGQLYEQKDLSGISRCPLYNMRGNALKNTRQVVKDYKAPVNWRNSVDLEPETYDLTFAFDALGNLLTEGTPDGSVTHFRYNIAGLLDGIEVSGMEIVNRIEYDANRQRKKIRYGNGIQTSYTYEWTTQFLTRQLSTRQSGDDSIVQDINHTYDPVGNLTRSRDNSVDTVFYKNQQVDPLSEYTYDALYRLRVAMGRQHPGINANTYKNNSTQGSFKQSIFSQLPASGDGMALEKYTETYTYDDSGNLVNKQHTAGSSSFSVDGQVEENNNHLKAFQYDAGGNQRQMAINDTVSLSFNCCENLVRTGIIERPDQPDDGDYYVYDSAEDRILKVNERMAQGGSVTEVSRKTYIGNYEVIRNFQVGDGLSKQTMERRTLRVMDDQTCVAIIHYWVEEDKRSTRFQMESNHGSISMEMDAEGQLISYEEYFPFGGTAIIAGQNEIEVALKDYRYSGKECDDSTGLYYYGARYYISWLGRWLNADPLGDGDGLNLYCFVGNNPFSYHDPNGQNKKKRKRWELEESKVKGKIKQSKLDGDAKVERKGWFPTGAKSFDSSIEETFVTSKSGVVAILKINGVAIQAGKNGRAAEKLTFQDIGTENQRGLKDNPHAEDWTTSSFRAAFEESKETFTGFLTSSGAPSESRNTGDVNKKHVFSLRINFSPCLGCVGTITSFKKFLTQQLGALNFILRVKFLRPYDLPKSLKSSTSAKANNFDDAIALLKEEGVFVRLQSADSVKKIIPTLTPTKADFGQEVIERLFPKEHAELTKSWKQLGVSRTK